MAAIKFHVHDITQYYNALNSDWFLIPIPHTAIDFVISILTEEQQATRVPERNQFNCPWPLVFYTRII